MFPLQVKIPPPRCPTGFTDWWRPKPPPPGVAKTTKGAGGTGKFLAIFFTVVSQFPGCQSEQPSALLPGFQGKSMVEVNPSGWVNNCMGGYLRAQARLFTNPCPLAGTPPPRGLGPGACLPSPFPPENGHFQAPVAFGTGGVLLHNPPQNPAPPIPWGSKMPNPPACP